ncbi:MAG: AAA family ATPase [Gammaproteobacteria bacterium]|nr:AAA family ATPase [Gammaproteobacteria bacterium]
MKGTIELSLPPEWAPKQSVVALIRGDTLAPEPINWLWPGWLAAGKMHILGGQTGTGKTTIALALAAALTTGGRWPDGTKAPVGDVVIWSGEDDPTDTLVPRLRAMGANMTRVHFVSGMVENGKPRSFDPANDMVALETALKATGNVRLLIVDPIVSAIAADSHKDADVRRGLQPLVDLAGRLRCALLEITYFSKGTQDREPIDRITGSLAFAALARVVMVCAKETPRDDSAPRRLLMRAKSNVGPDDGGFAYELLRQDELAAYPGIFASSVLWGESVEGSAREILAQAEAQPAKGGALSEARDWLRDFLTEGPQPQREIKAAADAHCHSWATVKRAQKALGIEWYREGGIGKAGAWYWRLPGTEASKVLTESLRCSTLGDEHLSAQDDAEDIEL